MFTVGGWRVEDGTLGKEGMMGEREIKIRIMITIKIGGGWERLSQRARRDAKKEARRGRQ